MQMYPTWSARDNYAVHKKRKKRKVKAEVVEEDDGGWIVLGNIGIVFRGILLMCRIVYG